MSRSSAAEVRATSCPRNHTSPDVGWIRRSTALAVVVLPLPDSPTSPNVSPASIVRLTSSTARTMSAGRRGPGAGRSASTGAGRQRGPWSPSSSRREPCAAVSPAPSLAWQAVQWPAARSVRAGTSRAQMGRRSPHRGSKAQPGGSDASERHGAGYRVAGVHRALVLASTRAAPACTGARARRRDSRPVPSSTIRPRVHHGDAIRRFGDDAEIVRDEQESQPNVAAARAAGRGSPPGSSRPARSSARRR